MKRIIPFVFLFFATSASAQLLYQISGNGLKTKSYLFATNRLCPIAFLDSVPQLFKIFNDCPTVITEMALSSFETQTALAKAALLPDSVLLNTFYTAEEYNDIDIALQQSLKMGLGKLARMKPAFITELYKDELYKKWLNYDTNVSSEIFFQSVAAEQGKTIIGLDGLQETIYVQFDKEPIEWQTKELLRAVNNPEKEIKQAKELLHLYQNGRIAEMAYQVQMPDNQTSISYSDYQVYANRNAVWVKQLEHLLMQESNFIVLDAIYLGGEKGLIAQLQKVGYKVKKVN